MDNTRWPINFRQSSYSCSTEPHRLRKGICKIGLRAKEKKSLFWYLLLLTSFFILLELSFFIICNGTYLYFFNFAANRLSIPLTVLPDILGFALAQISVHLGFCFLVWYVACALAGLFKVPTKNILTLGLSLFFLGIATVLVANCYLFPNAKFSELIQVVLHPAVAKILLYVLGTACLILVALTAVEIILKKRYVTLAAFVSVGIYTIDPPTAVVTNAASEVQPNIIIVGVDSLRPDFLGYAGHSIKTPFIDSFLQKSAVFSEAFTPLARTFPSWTAILTGAHPKKNGVRTNLAMRNQQPTTESIATVLRQQGYETIYASDETRFSNIDANYGFNQTITPPIGLNDFLLGTFNDFPISNLLVNTSLGKWLFPYSYANRAAYFTYDPDSFIKFLKPSILKNHPKPLFFAIHFCLPHHPYLWQQLDGVKYVDVLRYEQSIMRADQQLADFFALLKQAKLLDHAIVVLLSDHGEALELPGDRVTDKKLFVGKKDQLIPRFYPPSVDEEAFNQSGGHGGDVLGLTQYHSLLAFHLYGISQHQYSGNISGAVSLEQIKPTILSLLQKQEERALVPFILGKSKQVPNQHIFLESDFSPAALHTVHPETKDLVFEGIELFRIDPLTTRLIVRAEMERMIIDSKQYADIYGDWVLALYPQGKSEVTPILVNLKTGNWTNNLQTTFAKDSPAEEMLVAMKAFYQI